MTQTQPEPANMPHPETTEPSDPTNSKAARRGLIIFAVMMLIWAVLLFVPAGRLAWGRGWLMWLVMLLSFLANHFILVRVNREVLVARARHTKPTTGFDRRLMPLLRISLFAIPVVAGYDARWHWSAMPLLWIVPGVLLFLAGDAIIVWAMAVNRHLETTVRIQSDRGHSVVTSGPYRIVRHPMYVGCAMLFAGIPLMVGAWWACLPAAVAALTLFVRAGFEDALLRRELPGYEEFTRRTRWRLLPGVW